MKTDEFLKPQIRDGFGDLVHTETQKKVIGEILKGRVIAEPFPVDVVRREFEQLFTRQEKDDDFFLSHDLGDVLTPKEMASEEPPPDGRSQYARETDASWKVTGALRALIAVSAHDPLAHASTAMLLEEGLKRLRDYVLAGDPQAMRWYGRIVSHAVADLAELVRKQPETVREWSRNQEVVPTCASNRQVG